MDYEKNKYFMGEIALDIKKIAILGGDKRNIYLAKALEKDGHFVKKFGFSNYDEEYIQESNTLLSALQDIDYVICPIPCSHDGVDLNTPFSKDTIKMDEIFKLMKKNQIFIAGYIKKEVIELSKKYGVTCIDILKEELAVLNAIPTAEGALKLAIENTDFTLHGSKTMIIGYGRIGKILSKMLAGIGSDVFTVVNSREALALSRSLGHTGILFEDMTKYLGKMNIIFNTVPEIVINKSNARYINKNCVLIDLASPPYGIDFGASKKSGLKVIYANSLPGKIAPLTVASYIKDTIYNVIAELEE